MINAKLIHDKVYEIQKLDSDLAQELTEIRKSKLLQSEAENLRPYIRGVVDEGFEESFDTNLELETIVLRVGRPVLTINSGRPIFEYSDIESKFWKTKLENVEEMLIKAIPAVGRIELEHHPNYEWVGTGWLVAETILVTNRHVAEVFSSKSGNEFIFRQLLDVPINAGVDFLKEKDNPATCKFRLTKILHIEDDYGPDIAFIEVDQVAGLNIPKPIKLYLGVVDKDRDIAVIGYPAKDSRIPEQDLMEKIFGNIYNVKRLAPGKITGVSSDRIFHDCATLGGCSGGLVLDLATGEAIGLHFAGRFLESNYAVPASIIRQRLQILNRTTEPSVTPVTNDKEIKPLPNNINGTSRTFTVNVPLQITVSVDVPFPNITNNNIDDYKLSSTNNSDEEFYTEGVAEDYNDRVGYVDSFLGENFNVPLPEVVDKAQQKEILYYDNNGKQDSILRYEHFSVKMNKKRRLCFFSAVNIDGCKFRKSARTGWRRDPRIPKEAQIINECYGNAPKFSRGHMTRREDPIWGNETAALRGNADSMCVTNTVPQMQSFNAPIWLGLEDYALKHAREDQMKISVFTGPIFKNNDPIMYGVKIPVSTWKVIVFIHDKTKKLCATGYIMSQKDHLPEEEFVFGAYENAQVSINSIENMTGLSFGNLSEFDPLQTQEELFITSLNQLGQIRFT